MDTAGIMWRMGAIALCGVLYAALYVRGLELSHQSAYRTLENIRVSLQRKLEQQPLGAIQEKGVGVFNRDGDSYKRFETDVKSQ